MTRPSHLISTAALFALSLTALNANAATPIRYRPLTPTQLDQLTAPIALYPDPLLAIVLPASTFPLDLAIASQWLDANPTPTDDQIAAQLWDPSIQSLAHYPAIFHLLADDLAWTRQLGLAYANQPADLKKSIQRLRAKARAVGTLTNTPEQTVIIENHYIQILPAEPQVIYVPVYDPSVCYIRRRPPHFERPTHPHTPPPTETPTNPSTPPPTPTQPIGIDAQVTPFRPPARFKRHDDTRQFSNPDPAPAPAEPLPAPLQPAPSPAEAPQPTAGGLSPVRTLPLRDSSPTIKPDPHRPSADR